MRLTGKNGNLMTKKIRMQLKKFLQTSMNQIKQQKPKKEKEVKLTLMIQEFKIYLMIILIKM